MHQCNCVQQKVYKILPYVLRDHCSLRGVCSRSNPVAIFRGFALWLHAPQILQPRWTTAKTSCERFAWLLHWIAILRCLWTTNPRSPVRYPRTTTPAFTDLWSSKSATAWWGIVGNVLGAKHRRGNCRDCPIGTTAVELCSQCWLFTGHLLRDIILKGHCFSMILSA